MTKPKSDVSPPERAGKVLINLAHKGWGLPIDAQHRKVLSSMRDLVRKLEHQASGNHTGESRRRYIAMQREVCDGVIREGFENLLSTLSFLGELLLDVEEHRQRVDKDLLRGAQICNKISHHV